MTSMFTCTMSPTLQPKPPHATRSNSVPPTLRAGHRSASGGVYGRIAADGDLASARLHRRLLLFQCCTATGAWSRADRCRSVDVLRSARCFTSPQPFILDAACFGLGGILAVFGEFCRR